MKTYQGMQSFSIPKSYVQSIMFKKKEFTKKQADVWLRRHDYERIKPLEETITYYRARLRPVNKQSEYRIIKFNNNIKAVIEYK